MHEFTIQTLAGFAVFVVVVSTTAISTIPVTSTIVVFVVAVFITLVCRFCTFARAFAARTFLFYFLKVGILAFAFYTEFVFVSFATAIAAVPTTDTIVVDIVTGLVFDPVQLHAWFFTARFHVGTGTLAATNATFVFFAKAFTFAIRTRLGKFARAVIALGFWVEITCFFVGATPKCGAGRGSCRSRSGCVASSGRCCRRSSGGRGETNALAQAFVAFVVFCPWIAIAA